MEAKSRKIRGDGVKGTIEYYDKNAQTYYDITAHVDMSSLCDRFLNYVVPGGKIIDIGSGSGRDIKYFINKGYKASGIDASSELCKISKEHGLEVENVTIQDWTPEECYDGIWANASLIHLTPEELEAFLVRGKSYLNEDGVIFASMKVGLENEYDEKGRYFCIFDNSLLMSILKRHPDLKLIDKWYSQDKLGREDFEWFNFILGYL